MVMEKNVQVIFLKVKSGSRISFLTVDSGFVCYDRSDLALEDFGPGSGNLLQEDPQPCFN